MFTLNINGKENFLRVEGTKLIQKPNFLGIIIAVRNSLPTTIIYGKMFDGAKLTNNPTLICNSLNFSHSPKLRTGRTLNV